jgi:hypothetical protein
VVQHLAYQALSIIVAAKVCWWLHCSQPCNLTQQRYNVTENTVVPPYLLIQWSQCTVAQKKIGQLVYLSTLFPKSYITLFWVVYFLPFYVLAQTNIMSVTLLSLLWWVF